MFAETARIALAAWLRFLSALGAANRAGVIAYRARARRLASDARARVRRWGVRFELNLNDNVQRTFYYTGWYERAFLKFLQRELRPSDTYIDVGAHIGIHAAFAARLVPRGSVVAFEPAPDTSALLRRSLARHSNVEVVAAALGAQAGKIALRTNPKWHREDASTRSRFGTGELVCEAPLLRFDDWAASLERMDIVKIDAEGAEPDVLRGMSSSLQRLRPRLLAVEVYAPYLAAAGVTEAEIVDFLADHGYVRERTIGNNVVFRLRGTETAPAQPEGRVLPGALRAALYPAAALVALAAWFAKAMVLPDYNPIWRSSGIASDVSMFVLPGCALLAAMAAVAVFVFGRKDHSRALAGFVPDCVTLAGRLLADRRVPRRRKLLLLVLIAYLAMPIDPIPDFIPIAGQLDDLLVFALVFRQSLRAGGEPLVRQHWPGPASSLRLVLRLAGA